MFGALSPSAVMKNVCKALDASDLKYNKTPDGGVTLSAMGDDLPINMLVAADPNNKTLNIYCFLMFDIPEAAVPKVMKELNTVNNSINNGSFFIVEEGPRICFKIIQSFFDTLPSCKLIQHLIMIAFKTVDVNDGKLKDLIPQITNMDVMYS